MTIATTPISLGNSILWEALHPGVLVVRFVRPDLRRQLDSLNIEDCELYHELQAQVIEPLPDRATVIFNFGLVERFPTAFYQLMVKARSAIQAKHGRVILCGFAPEIQEGLGILQAHRLFEIVHKEEQALMHAQNHA
jgi:anti-anti-sigma regulatory factor